MRIEVSLLPLERALPVRVYKTQISVPLSQWLFGSVIMVGRFFMNGAVKFLELLALRICSLVSGKAIFMTVFMNVYIRQYL